VFDLSRFDGRPCLIDKAGNVFSYAEIDAMVGLLAGQFDKCGLVILAAENEVSSIVAYLAALRRQCPVMLVGTDDRRVIKQLAGAFSPRYVVEPGRFETLDDYAAVHEDLALLLSTSGSTGAAKMVRLSQVNILSNAQSIIDYLEIDSTDRAALTLPFRYSYGMSVINSHLLAGAAIWLTDMSVTDRNFWSSFNQLECTSFPGVPHTYQLLARDGFNSAQVPTLRHASQAGGHLSADVVAHFGEMARRDGWRFFVMYGQTEAAPRMSFVPPGALLENLGTIGVPVPGGRFYLLEEAEGGASELVYEGPNVMMGYALNAADLSRGAEHDSLHTGDLAIREPNGFYRIVGRKSRFIKPFGVRVSLDEVERKLVEKGIITVAVGNDYHLAVYTTTKKRLGAIAEDLANWLGLPAAIVRVRHIAEIPRASSGKINFAEVNNLFEQDEAYAGRTDAGRTDIDAILAHHFPNRTIDDSDSFQSLGGDSLKFIQFSLDLERAIGALPDSWEEVSITRLRLLASNGATAKATSPWRLSQVETGILLRAYAIICVVTHHLNLWDWTPQGSSLLLALAGLSFGRFQFKDVAHKQSTVPIWNSIRRVGLPTILYRILLQGLHRKFFLWSLLLVGNYYQISAYTDQWFLDIYLQTFALTALLLGVPAISRLAGSAPYMVTLGIYLTSVAAHLTARQLWDTAWLDDRVLQHWFWLFAWGLMMSQVTRPWQRMLGFVSLVAVALLERSLPNYLNLTIGASLAVFIPQVRLPVVLRAMVMEIAGATLFIYLTHFQISTMAYALVGKHPALGVPIALLGGVSVARFYAWAERLVVLWFGRRRQRPALCQTRSA